MWGGWVGFGLGFGFWCGGGGWRREKVKLVRSRVGAQVYYIIFKNITYVNNEF
jgi:hypothetical protein